MLVISVTNQFIKWNHCTFCFFIISIFGLIQRIINRMDDLESIFARIRSLAKANAKVKKGEEVINYIKNNYRMIQEEACRVRSPKRRTYGRCEGKLVDDFVTLCDYRCDAQNRTAVNFIMSSLKFGGYEDDKPRFRQRMENQMKKLRKLNKSVRPSNRNYFSESKSTSRERPHSNSAPSHSEKSKPASTCNKSTSTSLPEIELSADDIRQGLLFIPFYDDMDAAGDNSFFVFPEDVNTWQNAGVMNKDSDYSTSALMSFIQQNKESKQVMSTQDAPFSDESERIAYFFLDPNASNF